MFNFSSPIVEDQLCDEFSIIKNRGHPAKSGVMVNNMSVAMGNVGHSIQIVIDRIFKICTVTPTKNHPKWPYWTSSKSTSKKNQTFSLQFGDPDLGMSYLKKCWAWQCWRGVIASSKAAVLL